MLTTKDSVLKFKEKTLRHCFFYFQIACDKLQNTTRGEMRNYVISCRTQREVK